MLNGCGSKDMRKIEKLVRDKIPQIIVESGRRCEFRILDNSEYAIYLRKKLEEEVHEFMVEDSIEELADLLEVVEAIAEDKGVSWTEVMNIKQHKAMKKGTFTQKIFLTKAEA